MDTLDTTMTDPGMRISLKESENLIAKGENKKAELLLNDHIDQLLDKLGKTDETHCQHVKKELAMAYNNRGYSKYRQVEFEAALNDYLAALDHDPTSFTALYNKGMIHYRLGDFQTALENMDEALKLKPDFREAMIAEKKCREQLSGNKTE